MKAVQLNDFAISDDKSSQFKSNPGLIDMLQSHFNTVFVSQVNQDEFSMEANKNFSAIDAMKALLNQNTVKVGDHGKSLRQID